MQAIRPAATPIIPKPHLVPTQRSRPASARNRYRAAQLNDSRTYQRSSLASDDTSWTHHLLDFSAVRRKIGGAAAGFAHSQLARASGQSAHDLWTAASRSIHPARSSLERSRLTHKCAQFDTLPCCLECMTALFSLSFRKLPPERRSVQAHRHRLCMNATKCCRTKPFLVSAPPPLCARSSHAVELNRFTLFLSHLMHQITQVHKMTCS